MEPMLVWTDTSNILYSMFSTYYNSRCINNFSVTNHSWYITFFLEQSLLEARRTKEVFELTLFAKL